MPIRNIIERLAPLRFVQICTSTASVGEGLSQGGNIIRESVLYGLTAEGDVYARADWKGTWELVDMQPTTVRAVEMTEEQADAYDKENAE